MTGQLVEAEHPDDPVMEVLGQMDRPAVGAPRPARGVEQFQLDAKRRFDPITESGQNQIGAHRGRLDYLEAGGARPFRQAPHVTLFRQMKPCELGCREAVGQSGLPGLEPLDLPPQTVLAGQGRRTEHHPHGDSPARMRAGGTQPVGRIPRRGTR
jgi:hypothetical protein